MAVFQYNNRSIPYEIQFAPVHFDIMLLQGSEHTPTLWRDVRDSMKELTPQGGRIVTCEWADPKVSDDQLAKDFVRLVQTLGLASVRVVAFDDAVEMVAEAQRLHPGIFEKTLFFPQGGPKGEDLVRMVRELCDL